ncbi:MAG: helix-turn-helix transcriptional regulator [Candidatus Enterosoma sp.]|nr:helix-turn-helix transcriptional regulator [Candidatus Enterosoma sp.]
METLNDRIKNLRKEKGWTQLQLAEKLNVTDKAVSKWEVGEANPDISLIVTIASLFGVSIDYLLTGKSAEEKVVVMSNIELCCKDDDIERFNKLVSYTDDSGVSIVEYAKKYEAKSILKAVASLYAKGRIKVTLAELAPVLLNLGMLDALIEAKMLDYPGNNPTSLYYKQSYSGPRQIPCDYEAFRTPYDNRKILFDNWPKNTAILDYYFSFKSLDEKMENVKNQNRSYNLPTFAEVFYDFLQMAIDAKDVEKISFIWPYAKKYNDEVIGEYEESKKHSQCFLFYCPFYYGNRGYKEFHLVSLSNAQIIEILKLGMIDIAKEANKYSHIKSDWNNWKHSLVEDNQFVKYELIKNSGGKNIDTRIFDVKLKDIVIIERVLKTKDSKFIVETLKNNPINYSEFLFDLLKNSDYKKIFEFAVDNNYKNLACSIFRKDRFVQVFNLISTFIQFNSFEKNVSYTNNRFIMKDYCYDGLSEKEANALKEEEESEKRRLLDSLERQFVSPIKEKKLKIIAEHEAKIQMNDMVSGTFTKDFFMSEIAQQHFENCIIKLCTLFEMKLKADGKTGEFSKMIDDYCGRFYGDDGWGYTVCQDSHKVDILNRLRMQRNNILHADAKEVKPLSAEELIECVNEICDWEVR